MSVIDKKITTLQNQMTMETLAVITAIQVGFLVGEGKPLHVNLAKGESND